MTVILEVGVGATDLPLGRALQGCRGGRIELERVVPIGETLIPYVWVHRREDDEVSVDETPGIASLTAVDRVEDRTLYRVEWTDDASPPDLLQGFGRFGAALLEGHCERDWWFRLRFRSHQHIAAFYRFCNQRDLPVRIERVYPLTEAAAEDRDFELTPEQREALVLALDEGYFDTPKRTTMDSLAADLGISQQAVSDRVRRGTEKVLRHAFDR